MLCLGMLHPQISTQALDFLSRYGCMYVPNNVRSVLHFCTATSLPTFNNYKEPPSLQVSEDSFCEIVILSAIYRVMAVLGN